MKKLYRKDGSGRIRFLEIWSEGDEIIQQSGLVDSDAVVEHKKLATSKNIGKVNETSPEEQAEIEVLATITAKLKEGYFTTESAAESTEVILPMLAKVYEKEKHKIDWDNCYVQPKFDGMRCLAFIESSVVTLMSRKGREITTVQHINEQLSGLDDCILDGELYNLELGSFQNQMRAVKKFDKDLTPLVQFNAYDLIIDYPYRIRHKMLQKIVKDSNGKDIIMTPTYKSPDEGIVRIVNERNIRLGYEGSMVRWGDETYKINGRSSNLLKYKNFLDISIPIIDIIPSKQRPTWGQPVFNYNNLIFSAGTKFSHEEREEMLRNKKDYIGKMAELRYFELSDEGIPRFPIMIGIRLDL